MEEEEDVMGKEIKICLPFYKYAYSLFFIAVLSIIRGVIYTNEVGIALEPPIALLSAVFYGDTYVQESEAAWHYGYSRILQREIRFWVNGICFPIHSEISKAAGILTGYGENLPVQCCVL